MMNFSEKNYAIFSAPANKKIIFNLEKSGSKVFRFPPLETEKIILDEEAIANLKNIKSFDWIIFPDVLAVDYFLQILQENQIDFFEMDSVQVCAYGETVADRLRFVQLHADVIPTSIKTEDVFLALSEYIGKDELNSLRFLLPKESSSEYEIKENLFESGAHLIELPIYKISISKANEILRLKVLLNGGAIDEFIISSPDDLIALKYYFSDALILRTLAEVKISAIDKTMMQMLKEYNLEADIFQ